MGVLSDKIPCSISLILVVIYSFLGMITFAYSIIAMNQVQVILETFYKETYLKRYHEILEENKLNALFGITVAGISIGGQIGGLCVGIWSNIFGMKYGILCAAIISIISYILMGISKIVSSFEVIILGRFLLGFGCGISCILCPMYTSEVSPISINGLTVQITSSGLIIGSALASIIGLNEILGSENSWTLLLSSGIVFHILQILIIPFIPESPRFVYINKKNSQLAKQCLQKLRKNNCEETIQKELQTYENEIQCRNQEQHITIKTCFKNIAVIKMMFVGVLVSMSASFTGFGVILAYSKDVFSLVLSDTEAQYANVGLFVSRIIFVMINFVLVQKFGRRPLLLFGMTGMIICKIIFTVTLTYQNHFDWLKYISVMCIILYSIFFTIGPAILPFLIASEMFPQFCRQFGMSLVSFTLQSGITIIFFSFPFIKDYMDNLSFLPFICIAILNLLLLVIMLPETKNKTAQEIYSVFKGSDQSEIRNNEEIITTELL